jgi:predicted enzyme related to lactoylglutathione lyase
MWNELPNKGKKKAYTLWAPFPADTTYFEPSRSDFMVNFSVDDLTSFVTSLKEKGVKVEEIQETPQGKFTWVMDPDGNRIELWEPTE